MEGLEFRKTQNGDIGLFNSKRITKAGWLTGVWHNLTMTSQHALNEAVVLTYWAQQDWLKNRSDLLLAMYLVRERAREDESSMSYFVNALPDTFDTPLYWDVADLQLLEGTSAYEPALMSNSGPIFDYC